MPRQGPRRRITSVLNRPMTVSARALMLLCRSSSFRGRLPRLAKVGKDLPCDVALEAAHDLRLRLSFRGATADIVDVGWWQRIRVTMTRWRAALAWRLPPRFSLWRLVLPLEAGTGQAPHILANAASERMRSGLSPTRISISAAVPVAMPGAVMSSGVWSAASASRSRSCPSISLLSDSQRRARARSPTFADAVVEVIGPGRSAAR